MKALLVALLGLYCCAAAAQLREIPVEAKRGKVRHVFDMHVEIDGQPQLLARGAQIRDAENRIVVPTSVAPDTPVRYVLDPDGLVRRMWILSPREAAPQDRP